MMRRNKPRNLVKKYMESFNKPKTYEDKTKYRRQSNRNIGSGIERQ